MRALLTMAAVAAMLVTASTSKAQNPIPYYPWCAVDDGGGHNSSTQHRNCGFTSYAQCMNYVRGQTGICFENVWGASGPSVVAPEKRLRRR